MLIYLFGYVITQFLLFFVRDNLVVSFLGLNWGLKQAQWTSLVVFIILIPLTFLIFRFSKPIPEGEVAATYGIPQKSAAKEVNSEKRPETPVAEQSTTKERDVEVVEDKPPEGEETEEKIEK